MKRVKRTERGWGGHFICADDCKFRRNTLLEYNGNFVVISTVGNYFKDGEYRLIGHERHFETMVFLSVKGDNLYHDADICRQVDIDSSWTLFNAENDNLADEMHEKIVKEVSKKLRNNNLTLLR